MLTLNIYFVISYKMISKTVEHSSAVHIWKLIGEYEKGGI